MINIYLIDSKNHYENKISQFFEILLIQNL